MPSSISSAAAGSVVIAIVGRPNVGKSTLFNRLAGKRLAIVDDTPGVTRDWREGAGQVGPLKFTMLDTAGLEEESTSLSVRMMAQTRAAIGRAQAVLFVVDGREGITPVDEAYARELRKTARPIILVVNKCEGNKATPTILDAYRLGFGEPVAVSAAHGDGLAELYAALATHVPDEEDAAAAANSHGNFHSNSGQPFDDLLDEDDALPGDAEPDEDAIAALLASGDKAVEDEAIGPAGIYIPDAEYIAQRKPKIAIIGRPNVGKSTLVNSLLGEMRMLTGPEAGLTRDAIASPCTVGGQSFTLYDTAGLRRKSVIHDRLEKYSVSSTLEAIKYAEGTVLVVDAEAPLEKQDATIAALVEREGRALVIALNKWDKITAPQAVLKAARERAEIVLPQLKDVPIIPISAESGYKIEAVFKALEHMLRLWNTRISTSRLNRWLDDALAAHAPPMVKGRRVKLRYITQHKSRPPTFILFTNMVEDFPEHYRRYLLNSLRARFDLPGVPIRLWLRKSKNPYAHKD